MHQEFVETVIDDIVSVGNTYPIGLPAPSEFVIDAFRSMFDELALFTGEYKKSIHDKDDEPSPSSVESMDVETDKKILIARCYNGQIKDEVSSEIH